MTAGTVGWSLETKTRAQLLELCRERGLKATAWKRGRMLAALTGGEEPTTSAPSPAVSAAAGRPEGDAGKKAREARAKRIGHCLSANGCACEAWEFAGSDSFRWELCACGHTQWAHCLPIDPEPAA